MFELICLPVWMISDAITVWVFHILELNWALCVSPGQGKAGTLVSMKDFSYSAERQQRWGLCLSNPAVAAYSLFKLCPYRSDAPNQSPSSLLMQDWRKIKKSICLKTFWVSTNKSSNSQHQTKFQNKFHFQRNVHSGCLQCGWIIKCKNFGDDHSVLVPVHVWEETTTQASVLVDKFFLWWWSYTPTFQWK